MSIPRQSNEDQPNPNIMTGITLIMELTNEQGPGRESQVQPPRPVWEQFFGISMESSQMPTLRLENMDNPGEIVTRKVVKHHHNCTVEITGARIQRPAIIRFQRVGTNSFRYWVHGGGTSAYKHYSWLLNTLCQTGKERKWAIINPRSSPSGIE